MKAIKFSIDSLLDWALVLLWVSILIFVFVLPSLLDEREVPLMAMGALKIFNTTRFVEWERVEVIQFSFDQLNTAINYLFIAASALLGLVLKALIEPLFQNQKMDVDVRVRILLMHCSYGCLLSIGLGFYAKLFFNDLLMKSSFSFYNSALGSAVLFQIVAFFISALLLLFSSKRLIKTYYK